jgi:hypothetical protein
VAVRINRVIAGLQRVVLAWALLVIGSCAPAKVTTVTSPALDQYQIRSVVIMPFERLATPQVLDSSDPEFHVPRGSGVRLSDIQISPSRRAPGHLDQETVTVPAFVPDKVGQMIYRNLKKRRGIRVVPFEGATDASDVPPEQAAKETIRKTGSDAALIGRVLIYRERDGSKWGANPAAVGFEVKLIGSDGITLWSANYYERQRPLIEDLTGFWQHGGGFVTAEELAEYGAERIVRAFPFGTS